MRLFLCFLSDNQSDLSDKKELIRRTRRTWLLKLSVISMTVRRFCISLHCQSTTNGVDKVKKMVTKLLKVVAQGEPVYVPSRKAEGGQPAKCMIRLKELGGEYEDEYICAMFGNLALSKFAVGKMVIASLRFQTHESNGSYFQDVVANDIQKI